MKAADQSERVLTEVFPDLTFGKWNCRLISGSSSWSQHSWGNALDLAHREYGYTTNPDHQAYLDTVAFWLDENYDDLSLWGLLWRVDDHYDHIHIDHDPRGHDVPPCNGGAEQSIYRDGTVVAGDPGPVNGLYVGGSLYSLEEFADTLRDVDIQRAADAGSVNQSEVEYWQGLLSTPDNPEWADYRKAVEVRRV